MQSFQLCIVTYLKNIVRLSGSQNLGGINAIRVARKADIVSIPDPVDGVVYGDIEFLAGRSFVKWDATIQSRGSNSEGKASKEGTSRGNLVKLSIPKTRADLDLMFSKASDDELIVLFTDNNGRNYIFGLLHAPVKFRYNNSTAIEHSGKNGYECELYYDGPQNIFEYNGDVENCSSWPFTCSCKVGRRYADRPALSRRCTDCRLRLHPRL
jgi:hypothetical protein